MNDVQLKKWLWIILVSALVVFFLFSTIGRIKKHREEKKEKQKIELKSVRKTESVSPQHHYIYKTISFLGEYGDIVYLPSGSMAALLYATEPYCSINRDGYEECGERWQDISTKMGDTDANTELRFKSTNGKHGTLTIRIRDK